VGKTEMNTNVHGRKSGGVRYVIRVHR